MKKKYNIYFLSSANNKVLYIGVTNKLARRVWEHKNSFVDSFSSKYKTNKLIYYEEYSDVKDAIFREKCLKRWKRVWKERLINEVNPEWKDLSNDLI